MSDPLLQSLAAAVAPVNGLAALVLGGSRARGTAGAWSDYDIGLYYEPELPLDVAALRAAIQPLVDHSGAATLTELGGWGPWINGGGWLTIAGRKVDLLYRDLARVRDVVAECQDGRISMHYQPGHPHGFCSAIWMGEVALCVPVLDAAGAIAELKRQAGLYPAALQRALIARFRSEAIFSIENAEIAARRGEQTHIAGCAYRALCCMAQVLFAANRHYLINEKGALAEAAALPVAVPAATRRASEVWAAIGSGSFDRAIQLLRALAADVDAAVAASGKSEP